MSNDDIALVLQQTADLIELTDGNPHRARAFSRAARALQDLDVPVQDRLDAGTLTDVSGIGDAMADHVADVAESGTFPLHDELLNAVPPGLLDVMEVNGLGTKRTRRLWKELDITSLDALEQAAEDDQITALDGFGAKTQQNILENVRRLRSYESQSRLAQAWTATEPLLSALRERDAIERVERTGPLRRHRETVEQVDLLVATDRPDSLQTALDDILPTPAERSGDRLTGTMPEGIPLRVHVTTTERFGTDWWRTTGADEHCAAVEFRSGPPGDHADEAGLYAAADLSWVPPELREGQGEIDAAATDALPSLITTNDLHGCLHNHSTYSDGADSLRDMAAAARARGYSYFGICDHSQSLRIAGGLSPDEVRAQQDEIEAINDRLKAENADFRVFSGIESDILRDGSLDYDDEVLASFDFVVASVHTGFSMSEEEATERIVRAVQNPHTCILGHPTGRLLLSRDGYPINHERVIEACAEANVAIELNANPYRLDLDWRWVRRATSASVLIAINPDAHATDEIDYVRWGVAVARKGALTPEDCLNAKSRSAFADWLAHRSSET